jgi:hypothetical protein
MVVEPDNLLAMEHAVEKKNHVLLQDEVPNQNHQR